MKGSTVTFISLAPACYSRRRTTRPHGNRPRPGTPVPRSVYGLNQINLVIPDGASAPGGAINK